MKKITILKTILLSSFFILIGCNVDEFAPENELTVQTLVETESDLLNLMIGTYETAASGSSYGGQAYLASELIGNTDDLTWNGTFLDPNEFFNKNMITDNGMVELLFERNYEAINAANIVINNIDIIESSAELRNTTEGEAKFIRGLAYFDLARFFAKQYISSQTNTQPGVSINLNGFIEGIVTLPRNTVEETYNQAISDLTDAVNLLPASNGFFADKYAARAVLARLYLQQGDYEKARTASNDVIENGGHSLTATYEEAFGNETNSSEDVFSFQINNTDGVNSMNTFWALSSNGGRSGNPDVAINDSYYNSFPAGDIRATYFLVGSGGNSTTKWNSEDTNVALVRLAEMYLIRAEANVRLSSATGDTPMNDLNRLRMRANSEVFTSAVTLDDVLQERRFELAFEGHLLHDVHRLGITAGGLQSTDSRLLMPIPQAEIDANPNTSQNDGY